MTDSSNKEQMPLVLRYLHVDRQEITKDFFAFCECERGITGQAIADYIVNTVHSLRLRLADARGQSNNGASSMSLKYNGAAALVQQHDGADKAFYTHCMAHGLNLCIVCT